MTVRIPGIGVSILPPKAYAPLALLKESPDVFFEPSIQSEGMGRVEIVRSSILDGHGVFKRVTRSEASGYVNVGAFQTPWHPPVQVYTGIFGFLNIGPELDKIV